MITKQMVGSTLLCHMAIMTLCAQEEPRTYVALKAEKPIVIDGKADESVWDTAPWSEDFIDIEGERIPRYTTRMKMIWDDTNLYFFARLEEPHVWATLKMRDTVIFHNNDFEIFIDPDGDTHDYMEFEMNALNTVWDLWLTKPYRNGATVIDGWDIQGLQSAVNIEGTLNNPNDTDLAWSVEIAMPWSALTEAARQGSPPVNRFWRINFSRVNWVYELVDGRYTRKKDASGKRLPEYNWVWSPQGVINMHEPEHWGYVYFSEANTEESAEFLIPEDEKVKWALYKVYRELLRAGENFDMVREAIHGSSMEVEGHAVALQIEVHGAGWNLMAKSPFTQTTLLIEEDGRFWSKPRSEP